MVILTFTDYLAVQARKSQLGGNIIFGDRT
jgi:hypothetical protein